MFKNICINKQIMASFTNFTRVITSKYLSNMYEDPLHTTLNIERTEICCSIMDFSFLSERVRVLSSVQEVKENSKGILYWMCRDLRVQDNWAFLYSQKLALKNELPLHVVFILDEDYCRAPKRLNKFLMKGLKEVYDECEALNITFNVQISTDLVGLLCEIVQKNDIGGVVCDFFPLRKFKLSVEGVRKSLSKDILFCQVDAHNVVPCWEASPVQEYAARTIRSKIKAKVGKYLTPFPPLIEHPYKGFIIMNKYTGVWDDCDEAIMPNWAVPGYIAGIQTLQTFCEKGLRGYEQNRNKPETNSLSNLSTWLNYGQISAQRCVLEVLKHRDNYEDSVNAFLENIIVRRELSDNFCHYNELYDCIEGAAKWAQETLRKHAADPRPYVYDFDEFDEGRTHDPLWNAAQKELVKNGKLHPHMRMFWAKKILEWSRTPEEALTIAIHLNNYYNFDGRDPNGYVGVMWSICGVHDHSWKERAIFGKIRYMTWNSCKNKFNVNKYMSNWNSQNNIQK